MEIKFRGDQWITEKYENIYFLAERYSIPSPERFLYASVPRCVRIEQELLVQIVRTCINS